MAEKGAITVREAGRRGWAPPKKKYGGEFCRASERRAASASSSS